MIDTAGHERSQLALGLSVTVADALGRRTTRTIACEADATRHPIAPRSPPARALPGAGTGDKVEWPRPSGAVLLTITDIRHDDHPTA